MRNIRLLLPGMMSLLTMLSFACHTVQAVETNQDHPERQPDSARHKEAFKEFLNCRVVPRLGNPWDYTFEPGTFPTLEWDRPYLVEHVLGDFPLQARWFDGQLNEVERPEKPGRYAFYVEGKTPGGKIIRRGATVYCRPKYWLGWNEKPKADLDFLPVDGLSRSTWQKHQEAIAAHAGRTVLYSILRQQQGAVLLSFLHEMESHKGEGGPVETPMIRDHEYHLALKRKVLEASRPIAPLQRPQKTEASPAPVLRAGTEQEAGFKPGATDRIRAACRQWAQDSGEPFVALVARHGVVILHESFGAYDWGPLTRQTPSEMASLTKLVTGLLFAQFVDQGVIGVDDPVGNYLADFPTEGTKAVTLRHCFTHTTGLSGHEEWGGLHNPWMENLVANQLDELPVGRVHIYNGMGYDLAGRVMEVVTGKSVFRLMHEHLFAPLAMENTTLEEDLGFSCFSTAGDFARLGQLLLNRGSYGDLKFFSPQTFEALLPRPLDKYYPGIDKEWGMGITWMRQKHPDAGKNGVPEDATILSKNVIGHGSATSAILRVDLDNDLVIAQSRRRGGKGYGQHLTKFLSAIEEGLQ